MPMIFCQLITIITTSLTVLTDDAKLQKLINAWTDEDEAACRL